METIIQAVAVVMGCAIVCWGLEAIPSASTPVLILKRGVQVVLVILALSWLFGMGGRARACTAPALTRQL